MRPTLFLVLLVLVVPAMAQPNTKPLAGDWALRHVDEVDACAEDVAAPEFDASAWRRVGVPSTVLGALVEAGVYPDPYYGLNIQEIPGYVSGRLLAIPEDSPFRGAWWYRKTFTAPEKDAGRYYTLHFDGINFEAEVWLNGVRIARGETMRGMFRRFRFPVTEHLRYGAQNVLAVKVTGPGQLPDKRYRTKQIQATTGWDDHNPWPPDLNTGLWEDVYLTAHGPLTLRDPYVESDLALPNKESAALTVAAWVTNHAPETMTGALKAGVPEAGVATQTELRLEPGETREIILRPGDRPQLVITNPKLWWPVNLGEPNLYDVALRLEVDNAISDEDAFRFGVRHVTTYLNDEDWRVYEINGRKVLVRGGAWMTIDMLLNLTGPHYEALVRYAHEAGLNMLRSEGFSIRETDEFYRLCDEYGIMVTQQIFGRSIEDEPLALACAEDMMLRIRKHPSLVHFLGHDETFPTENLDQGYRALIEEHRLKRTYQPHSGTFHVEERKKTGGTRTGTHELWTYASPEHYYHRKDDGAWGFAQSGGIGGIVAAPDSIEAMMPADQRWPALETQAWSLHSVLQGGKYFTAFREAMNTRYSEPGGLRDFLRKAYAMNYNSARGMFEAYARNKYDASGITTWKYNAAWPAAMTWQYVDWYRRPTAAYFGAQKACEPLHIQFAYDDRAVWVVNTRSTAYTGLTAEAAVYDFDLTLQFEQRAPLDVEQDGKTKAFDIPDPDAWSTTHFLRLRLRDTAGRVLSENFYWLSTSPDIPGGTRYDDNSVLHTEPESQADFTALETLPQTTVSATNHTTRDGDMLLVSTTVKNTGDALAFLLWLDVTPGEGKPALAPAYWDTNLLHLLPGESAAASARLPAQALGDAKPHVRLRGWNISETWATPR